MLSIAACKFIGVSGASASIVIEIIDSVIIDLNAESMQDMGKVIANVNLKVSGKAEGRVIAEMVKNKLMN